MRIVDLIEKKKQGKVLSKEEINFLIESLMDGSAHDYQLSAWLMAVYFNGLTENETADLTESMINSGDVINLGALTDSTVDKHSTGGVGDKTSLIVAPICASLGIKMAKMSGRGLGHTGGTIDKLESIKDFNVSLETDTFFKQVNEIGISGVEEQITFESSIPNIKEFVLENLE